MSAPNKNYDPKATASLAPDEVTRVLDEALAAVAAATTLDGLKAARIAHEGDRAPLSLASAEIGALPPEARAEAGRRVGAARSQLREAVRERQVKLEAERDRQVLITEAVDVTLPGGRTPAGARHPVTSLGDRLSDVFVAMGYEVAEGPEVEAEWYNFDALNMLPDHPARDAQDTIFIESPAGPGHKSGMVLRTQTSPVQIRSMLNRPLPLYVVSPGRTYRHDPLDATHSPMFHQIEGLAVDEGITLGDLLGTIEAFIHALFGSDIKARFLPSYFPFTEPSVEFAMSCVFCRGAGCAVCSRTGWVELGGAGMVDPNVFTAVGIDPEVYTGFAFGFGIDRLVQLLYGVDHIKNLWDGDVRFIRQF